MLEPKALKLCPGVLNPENPPIKGSPRTGASSIWIESARPPDWSIENKSCPPSNSNNAEFGSKLSKTIPCALMSPLNIYISFEGHCWRFWLKIHSNKIKEIFDPKLGARITHSQNNLDLRSQISNLRSYVTYLGSQITDLKSHASNLRSHVTYLKS